MAANDIKLIQNVPTLMAIEGRPFEGIDLNRYIKNLSDKPTKFSAELINGSSLPEGLTCTAEGKFSGTPKAGTAKKEPYIILFVAESESTGPLVFDVTLVIIDTAEAAKLEAGEGMVSVKEQKAKEFWRAFSDGQVPNIEEILKRDVSPEEVTWLLERFATLTIWNADDLSLADSGKQIELSKISKRYNVYDFNVALIATPKDLFDSKRSFVDYIQTARGLMQEVSKRGWHLIELTGFDKMKTAAWIEAQKINSTLEESQRIEVRYNPTEHEYNAYLNQFNPEQKATLTRVSGS